MQQNPPEFPCGEPGSPHIRRTVLRFGFLALLFHIMMLLHISLYGIRFGSFLSPFSPHFGALDWSLLLFIFMIVIHVLPLGGVIRSYLLYICTRVDFIRTHRLKCLQIAQRRGVTKLQWYVISWAGFIWFLVTMAFSAWVQKSLIVLTLGIVGWWGSFHWQILRERRWCVGEIEEEVDIRSFTGTSIAFLLLYIIPIYWYMYRDDMSYQMFLGFVALAYSLRVFPTWAHFLLGKRPFLLRSFVDKEEGLEFSSTSLFYDNFGRGHLIADIRKRKEFFLKKYKFLFILFFSAIGVIAVLFIVEDIMDWFRWPLAKLRTPNILEQFFLTLNVRMK
ncbi:hypothetical protein [Pasteuria penetrans]|uniref:hypothetical protein n=1 Tax=Pasteuria penetrans TaxID=86005 RepID=UPI000FB254E2|nr:hypothetical protein [Pasteuria penetrans]